MGLGVGEGGGGVTSEDVIKSVLSTIISLYLPLLYL